MAAEHNERTFPSTRWALKMVRLTPGPAGTGTAAARRPQRPSLSRWNRRETLSMSIVYTGGPESWWLIKARGVNWRFPGHLCLEDVMVRILQEG